MAQRKFKASDPYRYPVDPTMRGFKPSPPNGHPGRCQGKGRHHGGQCKKWAITGRLYCQFHGGRLPLARTDMAGRYAKHVSRSLKESLDALSNEPKDSRADISDEIDLQRSLTMRVLKLYDRVVVEGSTNSEGDEATTQQKSAVAKALADNLETTTRLVERMVNIESKIKDGKIDIKAIDFIASQFGDIIERLVSDETLKDKIAKEIDAIMIPSIDPRVKLGPGD